VTVVALKVIPDVSSPAFLSGVYPRCWLTCFPAGDHPKQSPKCKRRAIFSPVLWAGVQTQGMLCPSPPPSSVLTRVHRPAAVGGYYFVNLFFVKSNLLMHGLQVLKYDCHLEHIRLCQNEELLILVKPQHQLCILCLPAILQMKC